MNNIDFIECAICNKKLKKITNDHLRICSNIDFKKYKFMYPNSPVVADKFKYKQVNCKICNKDIKVGRRAPKTSFICKECKKSGNKIDTKTKKEYCYFCKSEIKTSIFTSIKDIVCNKCKHEGKEVLKIKTSKCYYCKKPTITKKYSSYSICKECRKNGNIWPNITIERTEKIFNTYFENTGYENPMYNPKVIEKRNFEYFNKFGFNNPSQNPIVKNKKEETSLKNFGYRYTLYDPVKLQFILDAGKKFRNDILKYEQSKYKMKISAFKRIMEKRGAIHGKFFSLKNSKLIHYRSTYELEFFEFLEIDPNVLKYEYEPFRIEYFDLKTFKERHYKPDVLVTYINGNNELIEIKPESQIEYLTNKCKFFAAEKYCENNNLLWSVKTEFDFLNKRILCGRISYE